MASKIRSMQVQFSNSEEQSPASNLHGRNRSLNRSQRGRQIRLPSMRLMSIKYPNNIRMKPDESIEQELIIQNDGFMAWPQDTTLAFSGFHNQLKVIEEIHIGPLAPKSCTEVKITIKMPFQFPDNQDRYVLEYELRHSYQTIMIGVPIKLSILMQQVSSDSNWQSSNSFGNSSGLKNLRPPLGSLSKSESLKKGSPKSVQLKDNNLVSDNNNNSVSSNKSIRIKNDKNSQLSSQESTHQTLKDQMNKF